MTTASRSTTLLLSGWLTTSCGFVVAQVPTGGEARQSSRLAGYLYGKEQIGDLYAVGRQWDKKLALQQDCKGPYNIQPVNLYLLKPIEFPDGKPHPVAGVWQHRFIFERCGKRMTYNAVFIARPAGKPEARPHVPGNTNASTKHLAETLKTAHPAALMQLAKQVKDCKEADLIDTRLTHPPHGPGDPGKPADLWEESWTFRGCGNDVELSISFAADNRGGTRHAIKAPPDIKGPSGSAPAPGFR